MRLMFQDVSGIEQDKGEPGQESEPTQNRQDRPHPPVTLDHRQRERSMRPSITTDPESKPSLMQEEQHHECIIDAMHQPEIRKQLPVDQRILHR